MAFSLDQNDVYDAAYNQDPDSLQRLFLSLQEGIAQLGTQTGVDPGTSQTTTGATSTVIPAPPNPSFLVAAVGTGMFSALGIALYVVSIATPTENVSNAATTLPTTTNPAPPGANQGVSPAASPQYRRILYTIQCATDPYFSQNLQTFGPDTPLTVVLPLPFSSLYFRICAQYQNSTPTGWITSGSAPIVADTSIVVPEVVDAGVAANLTDTPTDPISSIASANGGGYEVSGFLNVTAYTAGTVELLAAFVDENGNNQSIIIPVTTAGGAADAANALGPWAGFVVSIIAGPGPITVGPVCAGWTGVYDVACSIVQVA
jgi:hypothetical protein